MKNIFSIFFLLGIFTFIYSQNLNKYSIRQSEKESIKKLIIAHRGGIEFYPENSIPAFESAVKSNFDCVECDVRLTSDSVSIIMHDDMLGRTTNVIEVFGSNKLVKELTYEQIKKLYLAGGNGWRDEFKYEYRVPSFEDVIKVIKNADIKILIDVKDFSNRNISNIKEILNNYHINPVRVIISNQSKTFYFAPPYKNILITATKVNIPEQINITNGITFDGSFYLSLRDSILNQDNFTHEFVIDNIINDGNDQTLFQLINHYNWLDVYYRINFHFPNEIILSYKFIDTTMYWGMHYNISSIKNILLNKTSDSLFVFINSEKKLAVKTFHSSDFRYPRLMIGTNTSNTTKLKGTLKSYNCKVGNSKLSYDLTNSFRDKSTGEHELKVMTVTHLPHDAFGIPDYDYNPKYTKLYNYWGFENYVWTVDDSNEMNTMLLDDNINGILTNYPTKLFKLYYPQIRLYYSLKDTLIKLFWTFDDKFKDVNAFEIQQQVDGDTNWIVLDTIINSGQLEYSFNTLLTNKLRKNYFRIKILKNDFSYFSDSLAIDLSNGLPIDELDNIKAFELLQNYPNPFNSTTVIEYILNKKGRVKIDLFDINGKILATLIDKENERGKYFLKLNLSDYSSSVYFYTIEYQNIRVVKKMILLK